MDQIHKISLPATESSLPIFRAFVGDFCQNLSIDEQVIYDIQLATDEVVSNIIEHGYAGLAPGDIILLCKVKDRELILEFTDFGHTFEPAQPQQPDIEALFEKGIQGGFGLFLIYQIMDSVSYRVTAGSNKLTLVKKLTSR